MHSLEYETVWLAIQIQNTFGTKDVLAMVCQDIADPAIEFIGIQRLVVAKRDTADAFIMRGMVVTMMMFMAMIVCMVMPAMLVMDMVRVMRMVA